MALDRSLGDGQPPGDLAVAQRLSDQRQDLAFANGKRVNAIAAPAAVRVRDDAAGTQGQDLNDLNSRRAVEGIADGVGAA